MRYCEFCGRRLEDGEVCTCRQQSQQGVGGQQFQPGTGGQQFQQGAGGQQFQQGAGRQQPWQGGGKPKWQEYIRTFDKDASQDLGAYERGKKIVGECVVPMEGEIPVRQYNMAILRTIFPFKRAEGRLQVTNKRVLFRAMGRSMMGRVAYENEFMLSDVEGIEIEKGHRVNGWFLALGLLIMVLSAWIGRAISQSMITKMYARSYSSFYNGGSSGGGGGIIALGVILLCAGVAAAVLIKKFHWAKVVLFAMSASILFMYGLSMGGLFFLFISIVAYIAGIAFLILFSIKDDLHIQIKVEDALAPVNIKSRARGRARAKAGVSTGFAEVLPWTDAEIAIRELGALIDDVKHSGNAGINKWSR